MNQKQCVYLNDGVDVEVGWANSNVSARLFCFTLTLPDIPDRVFHVVKGWTYDLENEGQCQAYEASPETPLTLNEQNQVWLHWDVRQKKLVSCPNRNWVEEKKSPLNMELTQVPPLSSSLLTIIVGLLAQDGDAVYFAPRLLEQSIKSGQMDEKAIRRAVKVLLQSPVVSPSKLARVLEKDTNLLPVLWPILTECMKAAGLRVGAGEKPPVWINRILDIGLWHAAYLAEAKARGLIAGEDAKWPGLAEIAGSKSKSTAVEKAKKLLELLG